MSNFEKSLHSGEPGTTGRELFEGSTATGHGESSPTFGTGYKEGTEAGDKGNHGEHDTDLGAGPHKRGSSGSSGVNPGQSLTGVAGSDGYSGSHHSSSSTTATSGVSTSGLSGQHAGTGAGPTMHTSSGHDDRSIGDKARSAVGANTSSSTSGETVHGDHTHSAHQDSTGHIVGKGGDYKLHQHGGEGAGVGVTGQTAPTTTTTTTPSSTHTDTHRTGAAGVGAGAATGAATAAAVGHSKSGDHGASAQSSSLQGDVKNAHQHGLTNQFDHADDALLENQRHRADVPKGDVNLDSANPANIAKDKAGAKADQESGKGGLFDKVKNAVGL